MFDLVDFWWVGLVYLVICDVFVVARFGGWFTFSCMLLIKCLGVWLCFGCFGFMLLVFLFDCRCCFVVDCLRWVLVSVLVLLAIIVFVGFVDFVLGFCFDLFCFECCVMVVVLFFDWCLLACWFAVV